MPEPCPRNSTAITATGGQHKARETTILSEGLKGAGGDCMTESAQPGNTNDGGYLLHTTRVVATVLLPSYPLTTALGYQNGSCNTRSFRRGHLARL